MKFRIGYDTEITDYVRDTIVVEASEPQEKIAQLIHDRIDAMSLTLNKSVYSQLKAQAIA